MGAIQVSALTQRMAPDPGRALALDALDVLLEPKLSLERP
jgi:hypothetical protein